MIEVLIARFDCCQLNWGWSTDRSFFRCSWSYRSTSLKWRIGLSFTTLSAHSYTLAFFH